MSWLDAIWNLPALPALLIWGLPVDGAVLWLIWRVKSIVSTSASWTSAIVGLPEVAAQAGVDEAEVRRALTNLLIRSIRNEVELMRKHEAVMAEIETPVQIAKPIDPWDDGASIDVWGEWAYAAGRVAPDRCALSSSCVRPNGHPGRCWWSGGVTRP